MNRENIYLSTFSSALSLSKYSLANLKQALEHVSNNDIHDIIRRVDKKHRNFAKDTVQESQFLLSSQKEDKILSMYRKKGVSSTIRFKCGEKRNQLSDRPLIFFQNILLSISDPLDDKWTAFFYEYDEQEQKWKDREFESLLFQHYYNVATLKSQFISNAYGTRGCKIKNKIILTESENHHNQQKVP